MDNRHLLPSEYDLLLDGEAGFGLTPLRAHLRGCEECRAEMAERQEILAFLEELPHHTPSPLFTERVMSRVHVFEPWHVTLRDTLLRLVPTSGPARALAIVAATMVTLVVGVLGVVIFTRPDAVLFVVELTLDRGRTALLAASGELIGGMFGDGAMAALAAAGPGGALLGLGLFVVSVVLAVLLLRSLTAASRRHSP